MKKLALLMLATLIFGCGTETPITEEPVIEEPEHVVEEPEPVIEKPPLVMVEAKHLMPGNIAPPQIEAGSVFDGDVDVDPEPLNRHGILFKFTENFDSYVADILLGEKSLRWFPRDVIDVRNVTNCIHLTPMANSQLLEPNTEYTIEIYIQDLACNGTRIKVKFRTKPE